jgi:hypothetical protein
MARHLVVGFFLEHLLQHLEGSLGMPLGGVDLRQGDGGNRWSARNGVDNGGIAADHLGRVRHVQSRLDDTCYQITSHTQPTATPLAQGSVGDANPNQLIFEFDSSHSLGAFDTVLTAECNELRSRQLIQPI